MTHLSLLFLQVLQHVRILEADNDLHIGNHSFSALRFQATGLRKNSVIFAGAEGFLTDSDKFTYTKGVLATPALRVEKLLSDVDARGNDISNAQLSNSKILGASIAAKDIAVPGLTGLAYFSSKGALTASSSLVLDSEGRLLITEVHSDINVHGHQLRDLSIHHANLSDIGSIRTQDLYLHSPDTDQAGLLMVQEQGKVMSLKDTIRIDRDTGNVAFKSLSTATLTGPMDTQNQELKNVNIQSGSATLSSVATTDLSVSSLQDPTATDTRLVFVDAQGKLLAQREAAQVVSIPHLSVQDIRFESAEIDFQGRRLKNMVLDSETFALGPQKSLEADQMSITGLQKTEVKSGALLFANSAGKIGASTGLSYTNGVLDLASSSVSASLVRAQRLTLPLKSAAFLSTTADGEVTSGSALVVETLTAAQGVTITSKATLSLQGREPTSLMALNAAGEVVAVHKPAQKGVAEQGIDAHLRGIEAESVSADKVVARRAVLQDLVLDGTKGQTESAAVASTGTLLVQNKVSLCIETPLLTSEIRSSF